MTTEQQMEFYGKLCELNGDEIVGLFTDYHGMQLLDDGFAQFCVYEKSVELDFIEDEP